MNKKNLDTEKEGVGFPLDSKGSSTTSPSEMPRLEQFLSKELVLRKLNNELNYCKANNMKARGNWAYMQGLEFAIEMLNLNECVVSDKTLLKGFTHSEIELLKDLIKNSIGYDLNRPDFKLLLKKLEGLE
jgi:hypothetical protein